MSILQSYASASARDSAAPAASNTGLCIFRSDTNAIEVSDGTNYLTYNRDGSSFIKGTQSADFGGTNEYVSIADSDSLSFGDGSSDSPFSITAWIKPDTSTSGFRIVSKSDTSNAEYVFATDGSGNLRVWICDSTFSNYIGQNSTGGLTADTWQHVAMTYSGSGASSGIKLYINNNAVSLTEVLGGSYTAMENLSMDVDIGRLVLSGGTSYTDGHMDDVAIIGKELSTTELSSIYNNNIYPTETVGLYRFEGNANDSVGSNNGTGQNSVVLNSTDVR
jgi:hypothetical protein